MSATDNASGEKLDKLLAGLEGLTARMDAVEGKKEEAKEESKADAGGITDTKEGDKLDTVLAHLDSLHKRMDSYEEKAKADAAKCAADGEEEEVVTDKKRADGDGDEKALAKEREENDLKRNDKGKKRADKARKDAAEEESEEMRGDKARADAVQAVAEQIAALERRIPIEMKEEDRARFVDAQSKAERVAQAFGDSAGAPRWLNGESLTQYRQRLLSKYKQHSTHWKDVEIAPFADKALDTVETQVYADALHAALHPVNAEGGALRQVIETDDTGRRIRKFYGDPEACWGPFKQSSRIITGLTTKFN